MATRRTTDARGGAVNMRCVSWSRLSAFAGTLLLAACVTVPAGPSMPAMPGSRKPWDQFQADDGACRQFAAQQGGVPADAAVNAGVGSAVVGTVLGAAVGGLLGGGEGAAVGAGMGLFTGGVIGAGNAQVAGSVTQQRFDGAYYQCMYAAGHRVPAPAGYTSSSRQRAPAAVASSRGAPPPNAAIPPPDAPPPRSASFGAPPNAAIPPPDAPAPYQLPR
jgi:hypothetical protein